MHRHHPSLLTERLRLRPFLAEDAVTVQRLGDLLVDRELRAPATVISANRALVTSEVSALIHEVPVDVGDTISQGEPLVVLDDSNNRLIYEIYF